MKQALTPIIVSALLLAGTQAIAGEAMTSDAMTSQHQQMMKDCMAKQKAKDSSMSSDAMKQLCTKNTEAEHMKSGQSDNSHMDNTPPKQ